MMAPMMMRIRKGEMKENKQKRMKYGRQGKNVKKYERKIKFEEVKDLKNE